MYMINAAHSVILAQGRPVKGLTTGSKGSPVNGFTAGASGYS
ncbi:MAG: hypothetical protein ACETWM_02030 [Candidatus Lokiarchaeia archaeon]